MEKVILKLKNTSYPIIIGKKLFRDFLFFWPVNRNDRILCVTDSCVASIYLKWLSNLLVQWNVDFNMLVLSDNSEKNKSFNGVDAIFTRLIMQNYDRNTVLVAFGGGVIGDLTGFVASVYQRGVRFIQVPTTLLAQVDASIGGKTGINHILAKNMIGSFYHPISVFVNLDFLSTLTKKEFSCGLSEVIKYAISFDANFFDWLEIHLDDLLDLDMQSLMYCVRRCCEIKASIVSLDECEKIGVRSLLNLGHTYGHAIEAYFGYAKWSHGEAVAAGIMMAISTSVCLGIFDCMQELRIKSLLMRAGLPICGPHEMMPIDYLIYIKRDKKSTLHSINLVLPVSIGNVKNFFNVDRNLVLSSIERVYN